MNQVVDHHLKLDGRRRLVSSRRPPPPERPAHPLKWQMSSRIATLFNPLRFSSMVSTSTYAFNDQSGQEWDNLLDPEDPLSDPVIWELCHGSDDATGNPHQGCSSHGGMNDEHHQNPNIEDQSMFSSSTISV